MLKTIKTIYTDYSDNEVSIELPILQQEDVQVIFKRKDNKKDIDNVVLFNNYYYFLYTDIMKNHKKDFIDFSKDKGHIQHSLISDSENENIKSTILIDCGEHYELYSTRRLNSDIDLDFYYKNNSIINYDLNDHMSQDKYCIVSTCVKGFSIYFIHPKDGLFYIPEKIQEIHSQDNPTFSRIENIKKHSYEVSDFTIKNSIDPIDISFEQYEFLEEKIPEVLKDINNSANIINDNTTVDKVLYIEKINKMSENLLPIAQLIEQWRQIMLAY